MTEAGPLGEEATRLLGAAQEWLHRVVLDPSTAKVATGSAECCWCPLCQVIAAARGDRPELAARMSDALGAMTELQSALAGLLRSVTEPPERSDSADRPARTVHRIDLSDQPEADQPEAGPPEAGPPKADQPKARPPEAGETADPGPPEAGETAGPAGGS
jgi:hypothetical protein